MGINSTDPRSSTPKDLPYPLHRLNRPQTKIWLISEHARRQIASNLARQYRGGVGVLSATQLHFAFVDPRGAITELKLPLRRYEMWQIANRPQVLECPCANYFDPEVEGPWRERGSEGHHPLCQFDRTSQSVFSRAAKEAHARIARGGPAQERPDEWIKIREEEQTR